MGKTRQKANLTSDNLITSDIDTDRIGINSSSPTATLDVGGDVNVSGIITATGGFNLGISSAGTSVISGPIKTLNFVGSGNTFLYNASTDTVDISISGGGGGGDGAIGIRSDGELIGTGVTTVDFIGAGITVAIDGTTGLVSIPGTTRTVSTYTATESQTSFSATYSVGYVDVFLNGVKLSSSQFTATDGTSIVLLEGASVDDVVEIVGLSNINISTSTSTNSAGSNFNELDAALFS